METQTFSAVLKKEEDMFVAECPDVGTVSQGKTVEEALFNLSNENCTIISYDIDLEDRSLILLNFDDFKEKNVNNIVILSDLNQFEKGLFIIDKNKVWLWKP